MENMSKIQIYKGIIQYLLESTNYNLKDIADLTNSSIKSIRTVHTDCHLPKRFFSEIQLIRLYQFVIEQNQN